jgi:predicted LPLAT superfamily acyltransferase
MQNGLSDVIAQRVRRTARGAVLVSAAALALLSAWVTALVALVVLLASYWGMAGAAFAVTLMLIALALGLVAVARGLAKADARSDATKVTTKAAAQKAGLIAAAALMPKVRPRVIVATGAGVAVALALMAAFRRHDKK